MPRIRHDRVHREFFMKPCLTSHLDAICDVLMIRSSATRNLFTVWKKENDVNDINFTSVLQQKIS